MGATTITNATLTADDVQRFLIMPLQQRSTYLTQPFRMFTSNGEPIKIPSLTSFGTATFVAQGTAIPEVNASTSEVELLASSIRSVKVIARMSRDLDRQSVVNVESAFGMKLADDVSKVLDNALWNGGTATTGSPLGMAQFSGSTNAGTVADTALTSGHLFDLDEYAYANNLSTEVPGAVRYAMSPNTFTIIRKLTDNYGQRVLQPSLQQGAPATLLGRPYVVTSHVPDTALLLFDASQIAVGMDERASITILDQTYAQYDEIAIRVTARYDTKPMNAAAVIKLNIS
ncbi:MAG: phage major capsid protein [Actinomycetales bacterium]